MREKYALKWLQYVQEIRDLLGNIGLLTELYSEGVSCFFFQAEDGIRDLVRSRGLGDVYKRQFYADGSQFVMNLPQILPSFEGSK